MARSREIWYHPPYEPTNSRKQQFITIRPDECRLLTYTDILSARDRLHPEIIRTPLHVWRHATERIGIPVHLKVESFQRTGSFKPRGAWNKLSLLTKDQLQRGVICASAGNHAQGVAFAASRMGVAATIVMPETAPRIKVTQTRLYGDPEIIIHGNDIVESMTKALALQKERGSIYIHAYDDDDVIAGQGTLGLEIVEQCPDVDAIVVPVGGGGLISGIAVAVRELKPHAKIIGVQAKGADALVRALETGTLVTLETSNTIADGINVRAAGKRPFEILSKLRIPVMRISDERIRAAMIALCQTAKLVVEPSGAASSAVLLYHPELFKECANVVVVVSGANIDICCYAAILQAFPRKLTQDIGIDCATCMGDDNRSSCVRWLKNVIDTPPDGSAE